MASNVKDPPYKTVDLGRFLGLFTEASPESLPEGASPLSLNDDFTIGGVLPRPGTKSVFTLSETFYSGNAVDGGGGIGNPSNYFDKAVTNSGVGPNVLIGGTPTLAGEAAIIFGFGDTRGAGGSGPNPGAGWTALDNSADSNFSSLYAKFLPSGGLVNVSEPLLSSGNYAAILAFFGTSGLLPTLAQQKINIISGSWGSPPFSAGFASNNIAGNAILVALTAHSVTVGVTATVTDTQGNAYVQIGNVSNGGGIGSQLLLFLASNIKAGPNTVSVNTTGIASGTMYAYELANLGPVGSVGHAWQNPLNAIGAPSGSYATVPLTFGQTSNQLQTTDYGFAISPGSLISSLTVKVNAGLNLFGFPGLFLSCSLIYQGTVLANIFPGVVIFPNGPTDTIAVFSVTNASLGGILTPTIINDASFGVQFSFNYSGNFGNPRTARLAGPQIQVVFSATSGQNFNYLKTFEQTAGEINTLALDDQGTLWREDAINAPGALKNILAQILPQSFAQSATLDDREFIAFSNLLNGTDIPRTYDGTNFDRLSQVGPGAPPTASATRSGSAILSITQNPAVAITPGPHARILISDSPSDRGPSEPGGTPATPGNVLTIVLAATTPVPSYLKPGMNIVLAGFPTINGNIVNNDPAGVTAPKFYTVTTVGLPITGLLEYNAITVVVPFTTFYNQFTPPGCTFQATDATMTTAVQVPNLEVGSQFQISGSGGAPPAGYDNTWLALETPNASQLQITSTSLTSNIATYGFNLITGTAPVVGQSITVSQTLNGNGVFNVAKAIITAVTAGTFSFGIQGADVPSAAEDGSGIIFGTIFIFDAFAIVGNKFAGTVVTSGTIAAGVRKVCYSFLTRDGYMTQPSPILTFDVPTGASAIAIGSLLSGPSNVIARVIHLTAADEGNFYNIPVPVTVLSNGVNVVNSSTYVNDNSSGAITLSFSDDVLLASAQIDTEGNNLFETGELGAPVALVPYAGRLFAIGEQNKVQNFRNLSFDGGVGITPAGSSGTGPSGSSTFPAGWTVDPVSGTDGSVVPSPIFGGAYLIAYNHILPSGLVGMISQPAFQDEFQVAIIQPSTTYSVRITASGSGAGNLLVDLYSPSLAKALGTFSLNVASLTSRMSIFTGTLLTTTLAPIPNDLILRVYANALSGQILIDRVEPFPTEQPTLSNQIIGSYQGNFEAFDRVEGVVNTAVQNQQPTKSAFTLFDTLYIVKSGSLLSTQDNKTTQPARWSTPRVISNVVGTPSVYGVAGVIDQESGEEWAIIAGQAGAFVFNGGVPIKIMEEIQSVWDQINWAYGYTLWVKNDIINRRILVGVPMKARDVNGNFPIWLPPGTVADTQNPTTPNVILALNYQFLNTASALADRPELHVSSFGGKLISTDMSRKWSIWTIQAPCAAFIKRADSTAPLMFGNSAQTAKIYQLTPGLKEDDGIAFLQTWVSHGFVTAEQEQGLGLGSVRKLYEYMTTILGGSGEVTITVYPDSLSSPYAHPLLPNLTLPATTSGDVELPVNELGNRLFLQFTCNAVGAGFSLSRIVMAVSKDPWSQVRGINA